jgi:uncharacterized protein
MKRASIGIGIFARAPIAGQAKTRLAPRLGFDGAARLQARLIAATYEKAIAARVGPVEIFASPRANHHFFDRYRAGGTPVFTQRGDDLGLRMFAAFREALRRFDAYLLVGTDCPPLAPCDFRDAARALRGAADAVVLPVEDGGYALIGLRRVSGALFENIAWGTAEVYRRTREQLALTETRGRSLRTLWDLDLPVDLDRFKRSKFHGPYVARRAILQRSIRVSN